MGIFGENISDSKNCWGILILFWHTLSYVCKLCLTPFYLGCLLLSTSASFVFKIYRLLFPTLLDFMSIWTALCSRDPLLCFRDLPAFVSLPAFASILAAIVCGQHSFALDRGHARCWWCVPLSCRLTRLYLNSVSFWFEWRSILSCHCFGQHFLLFQAAVKQYKLEVVRAECPDFTRLVHCYPRFWLRVLLSCRLTRLYLNSVSFWFEWRSILSCHCFGQHFLLFQAAVKQYKLEVVRAECPDFTRLVHCYPRFWWRVLLSCRLTRLDLNSLHFSIAFKDGVPWRLHSRISSFWTSPGRFRRIVVHVQVRLWRRIDGNDARSDFMRRKTEEKIPHIAAFVKMN